MTLGGVFIEAIVIGRLLRKLKRRVASEIGRI